MHYPLVGEAPAELVRTVLRCFKVGRPWPTALGAIAGALIGASAGLIFWIFVFPGVVIGVVVGATAAAIRFPRAKAVYTPRCAEESWEALGPSIKHWRSRSGAGEWIVVLLERAIYVAIEPGVCSFATKCRLEAGEDPMVAGGVMILLSSIRALEIVAPGYTGVGIHCHATDVDQRDNENMSHVYMVLRSLQDREEFFARVEKQVRRPLSYRPREVSLVRALAGPTIALFCLVTVVLGSVWIADYWRANPPRSLKGTFEIDPAAQAIIAFGPRGFLLLGIVPVCLAFGWLLDRVFNPPRLHLLELR